MHQALLGEGRAIPLYALCMLFAILYCSVFFTPQEAHANVVYSSGYVGENMVFVPSGSPVPGEAQAYMAVDIPNANAFPFATGTPVFYTISTTTDRMRVKRISGSSCATLLQNHVYFGDRNGNGTISTSYVNQVEDHAPYCDLILNQPVVSGDIFILFATYAGVVLDGSTQNKGAMYDGYNNKVNSGGPAFQLCNVTCDADFPTTTAPVAATTTTATSTTATSTCTTNCYDNVMFLPGIEGSVLYDDSTGITTWLPASDTVVEALRMNPDGTSVNPNITTIGTLAEANLSQGYHNVYKSFLNDLNSWQQTYGITATSTPYDWRLDFHTIVSNGRKLSNGHISYLVSPEQGHDPYLIETLKNLASTSKTGKVTIITHSMGGLIAKQMMLELGATSTAKYIDKVVFVATPQLGTPTAVARLLHGNGGGIQGAISDEKLHDLSQNISSAYGLLPSNQYFNNITDSVITFDGSVMKDPNTQESWKQKYSNPLVPDVGINTQDLLKHFMTDTARISPPVNDLVNPAVVSASLFDRASLLHVSLDQWTPPAGVQIIAIAGWGNETLSGIHYGPTYSCTSSFLGICRKSQLVTNSSTISIKTVIDGDGTVVEPSALWGSGSTTTRYWINLNSYNRFVTPNTLFVGPLLGTDHSNILEISQLRTLLLNIVSSTTSQTLPEYITSIQPTTSAKNRLHFTLHSPLTLGFTDSDGNYTGATATTTVFNNPQVDYERFGEVQWLSVPKDLLGKVEMRGTGTGSFTLDVEEQSGNMVIATTTFAAIPSATSTLVTLVLDAATSTVASTTITVDYDGNGVNDATYYAGKDSVMSPDITPPVTTLILSGSKGTNGWYISNVTATISATDTESDVAHTYLQVDGATTTDASVVIANEGQHTITYYSVDAAGNAEIATTTVIKIDKSAPEALISFSTSIQKISTFGIDTLSTTTVIMGIASTVVTDAAGHRINLNTKSVVQTNYASLVIPSFAYDASPRINATSSLRYFWQRDKTGKYTLFISSLRTSTDRLVSVFVPLSNKTYLLPSLPSDDLNDLSTMTAQLLQRKAVKQISGMIVPYIITKAGIVSINY